MEPIRVLQIVTTMERAGLETMIMNYYRNIDRTKVQFDFLRHRDGKHAYDNEIESLGGRIYTVPAFNPLNTNGYLTSLDKFFREHKEYKIVHAHLDCLSSLPLKYAKKNGIPVLISHSHVSQMTFDLKYPIRMFYRQQIPHIATHLMACSENAGKWMFGKHNYLVVTNAIDCDKFTYDGKKASELRIKYGIENKFVVGHVGRFDPVKNHEFIVRVFYEIVKKHNDSILLLAGIGNEIENIKDLVNRFNLNDKVIFLGSIDNVSDVMQMMDVFIFPSLYEGLGISLVEAQASGLPCYTSLNCVPQSVNITGNVQFLSLKSNVDEWVNSILMNLINKRTRKNCSIQIRNAGYDIKLEAKKLENIYMNLYKGGK